MLFQFPALLGLYEHVLNLFVQNEPPVHIIVRARGAPHATPPVRINVFEPGQVQPAVPAVISLDASPRGGIPIGETWTDSSLEGADAASSFSGPGGFKQPSLRIFLFSMRTHFEGKPAAVGGEDGAVPEASKAKTSTDPLGPSSSPPIAKIPLFFIPPPMQYLRGHISLPRKKGFKIPAESTLYLYVFSSLAINKNGRVRSRRQPPRRRRRESRHPCSSTNRDE